jgi:hypothetical protein
VSKPRSGPANTSRRRGLRAALVAVGALVVVGAALGIYAYTQLSSARDDSCV